MLGPTISAFSRVRVSTPIYTRIVGPAAAKGIAGEGWGEAYWYVVIDRDRVHALRSVSVLTTFFLIGSVILAVFAIAGFAVLTKPIIFPLLNLRRDADVIASGNLDHRSDVQTNDEIGDMAAAFNSMADTVAAKIQEVTASRDALHREVEDRRIAERTLRESEERFRQLAENIRGVFWVGSPDWKQTLYISPGYEEVWGRSCSSLYEDPASWLDAIHAEDRERVVLDLEKKAGGDLSDPAFPEYRVVRPDGSVRWVLARAFPIRTDEGEVIRIAGIAEDITEARENQAHLIQVSKLASLGEMATGAAHEINQPLNVIRMAADAVTLQMKAGDLPPDFLETRMEWIASQAQRAADIIDRMRVFGRKPAEKNTRISCAEAVRGATSFLQEQLRLHGIDLSLAIPETCRPVMGDFVQMEQVILNLLTNARDAIEESLDQYPKAKPGDGLR